MLLVGVDQGLCPGIRAVINKRIIVHGRNKFVMIGGRCVVFFSLLICACEMYVRCMHLCDDCLFCICLWTFQPCIYAWVVNDAGVAVIDVNHA